MISARVQHAGMVALMAILSIAADFADVNPLILGPDDPRTKEFGKTMGADLRRRMQEANLRESKAFAGVTTREQWEAYRDERLKALRASLGTFPEVPKDMRIVVTRKLDGDGYTLHNTVYETRPGFWVTANVYLPAKPVEKMPGIVIAHAHHTPKGNGELQDMGMTWARSGVAVLVLDQVGYGERRQHDFHTDKDFPTPFRPSRQDYYFRYNSNLQLSAIGDSLMGWMVWDLMRSVDVLLKQPNIDPKRILLLGSVAGGGDPAGVTAALDPRIACVVPFNFGGWQPESSVSEDPDRDTPWFGDGYWESTRGLRYGARDGFAHFVIVGSMAPRSVIYAHEFAWDAAKDPAWPRLQKIFGFYDAKNRIASVHGKGSVRGPGGPDNTHCTHIGAVHRKPMYPLLREWFGMAIPEEYSNRRPSADLICWTEEARKELKPRSLAEVAAQLAQERRALIPAADARKVWGRLLGNCDSVVSPMVTEVKTEEVPGGSLQRVLLQTDPGILVPVFLLTPKGATGKSPAVVMVASAGKQAFLKERGETIAALLKAGVAVCLVDVRGTGETRPGTSAERGSSRTSVSQTNLILGQPVLGSQLRDLRTVLDWLAARPGIDGKRLAVWGDSFAKVNAADVQIAVPLDVAAPAVSEPGGANLALLAGLFEERLVAVVARGGLAADGSLLRPYLYVPHDAVVPAPVQLSDSVVPALESARRSVLVDATVDAQNRPVGKAQTPADVTRWLLEKLTAK